MSSIDDEVTPEQQVAAAASANEERTRNDDMRWMMSSPRGRRIMWWLLELTGVYRTSFNQSGSVTAFNEGARNIGLRMMERLNEACFEKYAEMVNEQKAKK